jgi:tetratricopeptide (TPR) repeat protein
LIKEYYGARKNWELPSGAVNACPVPLVSEKRRKMKLKYCVAVLFTAALFSAGGSRTIFAQTMYEIEGTVYGPDSKAVANVVMTLQNHAGAQVDQDITKSDGRYRFSGVLAGIYYISAKPAEAGLQQVLQKIELINTGVNVTNFSKERYDFSLKKAPGRETSTVVGTVFAQSIPPEAEKEYLSAINSISKGEKSSAISKLRKAIELFPTYFLALEQLGLLYIDNAKDEQAIEPLTKAIQVNSKSAQSHLGLGMAYVNLDRVKEAITELNLALALDSRLFRAHLYLGMALITAGNLDDAERSLKEAYSIGGPVEARAAHLYLASIYNTRKEYQKAIRELEAYLHDNPKAPNAAKIQEAIAKLKAKL